MNVHQARTVMYRHSLTPLSLPQLICLAGLTLMSFVSTVASAQPSQAGIHVEILGSRSSMGTVACASFEAPEGFPTEFLRFATNIMMVKVRAAKATCDFEDIAAGTYDWLWFMTKTGTGELATNWMGVPKEGYGFSTHAKAIWAPSFEAASFPTMDKA
jgi:uncharacterized protein (DUF2141 family)